jgi:hypothetical protein
MLPLPPADPTDLRQWRVRRSFSKVPDVREGEYLLEAPRRVTRSRRGAGVTEYRIRLSPKPPPEVCAAYNANKPEDAPQAQLRPEGFIVLCAESDIVRRLELLRQHSLTRLTEITIDLRDPT